MTERHLTWTYRAATSVTMWVYSTVIMWPFRDSAQVLVRLSDQDLRFARQLSWLYLLLLFAFSNILPKIQELPANEPLQVAALKRFLAFALSVVSIHTVFALVFNMTLKNFLLGFGFFTWLVGGPAFLSSMFFARCAARMSRP